MVVIIAILAAVTIVAYNGLQDRANRTSQIQAATQIAKRINAVVVSDGLNVGSGGLPYCVPGTAKDIDGDSVADCSAGGRSESHKRPPTRYLPMQELLVCSFLILSKQIIMTANHMVFKLRMVRQGMV